MARFWVRLHLDHMISVDADDDATAVADLLAARDWTDFIEVDVFPLDSLHVDGDQPTGEAAMKNYIIHARHNCKFNLDFIVCAADPDEAVRLWRRYVVENEWLAADEKVSLRVNVLPSVAPSPMVYEWDELESVDRISV